jgi:hypothetical protein
VTDENRIDIKEFLNSGYLQEANRRFFHPLGLALEVEVNDDGNYKLGGVWDYRNDPEGIYFSEETMNREKYENVQREWSQRQRARREILGYVEQDPPPRHTQAQSDRKVPPS